MGYHRSENNWDNGTSKSAGVPSDNRKNKMSKTNRIDEYPEN